ncbi:MAG: hypothetical protein ACREFZ_03530 [Acetobacteraceae bacterium]
MPGGRSGFGGCRAPDCWGGAAAYFKSAFRSADPERSEPAHAKCEHAWWNGDPGHESRGCRWRTHGDPSRYDEHEQGGQNEAKVFDESVKAGEPINFPNGSGIAFADKRFRLDFDLDRAWS